MTLERVRKRDGREVPFDETKIRDAVDAAQRAVAEEDPTFAREVAALVRMTLEGRSQDPSRSVPHIEEIQDLVEQALIELGRARVAKAYILYRDRRARVREALRVESRPDARLPESEAARGPRVLESGGTSPWSKGRIVAALLAEADLERGLAEDVAARVEKRVFDAGLRRISTALIRELVDNELVDLGLSAQLLRQGTVGLPRHDLRELLTGAGTPGPRGVAGDVADRVLSRFALEEVFPPEACELHLAGEIDLIGAARPHLHLVSAVPADLLLRSEPGPEAAFALLEELGRVARCTGLGVVLEDAARALQPLVRQPRGLSSWLRALAALAEGSGRALDLGTPGPRGAALARAFVEERAALGAAASPRLYQDVEELAALADGAGSLAEAQAELVRSGVLVPTWSSAGERFAAPGCRRAPRERAAVHCGGAVAINLPRLARRAGPWCEERLLADLHRDLEVALGALAAQRSFQDAARSARPGEVRGRVMYAVAPVGLREALAILGDGQVRADQGARILGLVADALRRTGAERRLSVVASPLLGAAAARRFAELDAGASSVQEVLFADVGPGGEASGRSGAYGASWRLSASIVPTPDEARLLSTVPSGALAPAPRHLVGPPRADLRRDRASAWRAFLSGRSRPDTLAPRPAAAGAEPSLFEAPERSGAGAPSDAR